MVTPVNINTDQLKTNAAILKNTVTGRTDRALRRAANIAEQGYSWAAPRAQSAYERTLQKAAPVLADAAQKAQAVADRVNPETVTSKGSKEVKKLKTKKAHRSHFRGFCKFVGLVTLGSAALGAGYILWKRSQPLEDPWAEEYWADLESDSEVPDKAPESIED